MTFVALALALAVANPAADMADLMSRVRATPAMMQLLFSAKVCAAASERAEAVAAIAKEKKYSKMGGVVHLKRVADLQDAISSADDDLRTYRAKLKRLGRPAMSCKNTNVQTIAECFGTMLRSRGQQIDHENYCTSDAVQPYLEVAAEE